ncbi:unnamed protein product, partial [Tetraodon nigroviridis]
AELSFTLEPGDIIAVQEQPLMLHCQVSGIPPVSTHWRHNGLLLAQDQHHTTFINGSLLIAHFLKTRSDGSSDEGDYECVAQNSFGLVVSRRARIQAAKWLGTGGDLGDVQPRVALLCDGGPGHSLSRPTHLAVVEAPPFVTADSGWVCFPRSLSLRLPLPQFQH